MSAADASERTIKEYEKRIRNDKRLVALENKVKEDTARYSDARKMAEISGKIAAQCLAAQIRQEYPEGQITEPDARILLNGILHRNYRYVTEVTERIQNTLNQKVGLGLKAIVPEFDKDRESGLIKELSRRSMEDGFS